MVPTFPSLCTASIIFFKTRSKLRVDFRVYDTAVHRVQTNISFLITRNGINMEMHISIRHKIKTKGTLNLPKLVKYKILIYNVNHRR